MTNTGAVVSGGVGYDSLLATVGRPEARDHNLLAEFGKDGKGLTQAKLDDIRNYQGRLYGRLLYAAQVLFDSLLELREPHAYIVEQFNHGTLAALVHRAWRSQRLYRREVEEELDRVQRRELAEKKLRYEFENLSHIQLFREKVSVRGVPLYRGNLHDARGIWQGFQPSARDFERNVRLPTEIGFYEALLLGVFWMYGNIYQSGSLTRLNVRGGRDDANFFTYVAGPLVKIVHNYTASSHTKKVSVRGGKYRYEYPFIGIDSSAICTWLVDDLGFTISSTKDRSRRMIPIPFGHLLVGEGRFGFFAGMLAAAGNVKDGALSIQHENEDLINDAKVLAGGIGYASSEPYFQDKKWHIEFGLGDTKKMGRVEVDDIVDVDGIKTTEPIPHAGLFFNKRHLNNFVTGVFED